MESQTSSKSNNPFFSLGEHFLSEDEDSIQAPNDLDSNEESDFDAVAAFKTQLETMNLDQLDELTEELETAGNLMKFEDFDQELVDGMMDMLGHGLKEDDEKPDPVRLKQPESCCDNSVRKPYDDLVLHKPLSGNIKVVFEEGEVFFTNGIDSRLVGVAKSEFREFYLVEPQPFLRASHINESSSAKGCGMGFSSFIHLVAICVIASFEATLEPVSGHDLDDRDTTFEMTGVNYRMRSTGANVVLNKYSVISAIMNLNADQSTMMDYSYKEDVGDFRYMMGTSADQGYSPYNDVVKEMGEELLLLSIHNITNISNMLSCWYSKQPIAEYNPGKACTDKSSIIEAIKKGGKEKDGVLYYPSPLRVLPGDKDLDFDSKANIIEINPKSQGEGYSTYRTLTVDDDWKSMLMQTGNKLENDTYVNENETVDWMHRQVLKYKAYASIVVEADLLSKINGNFGCFYSQHSQAGITWSRTTKNSLTYYANYYVKGAVDPICGQWSQLEGHEGWFKSPTFKLDNEDIAYAKVLPGRFLAMVSVTLSYCKDHDRWKMIEKLMLVLGVLRNSSWTTSAIAGDMRFMVLNMLSGTGDRQKEHDDMAKHVTNKLRFSDYALLDLALKSDEERTRLMNVTPFFRMDMRFLNMEKDLSLMMMWKPRPGEDPFLVVKKPILALLKEQKERPLLLENYWKGVEALKMINRGEFHQEDMDEYMDNLNKVVFFNIIMFIGLAHLSCDNSNFGMRQKNAGVKISTLMSYKWAMSIEPMNVLTLDNAKIKQVKQISNFTEMLKKCGDPKNIYALLVRVLKQKRNDYVSIYVPKNGKSSRREVPQMGPPRRLFQMFSENNGQIYVDQEPIDNKTDPAKFSKLANAVHEMLSIGAVSSSEDKSEWCHNMHAPFMGLGIAIVARLIGSTGLVSTAAKLVADTSRWTVLPPGCEDSMIDEIETKVKVAYCRQKKVQTCWMVKHYRSMQQGQDQTSSSIIGTVAVKGLDILHKRCTPDIEETYVVTTADDESRTMRLVKDPVYNPKKTSYDYVEAPMPLLKHCLMENNWRKHMVSWLLAEFNNATAGPYGMYNSQLAQCFLCLQPLRADNPLDDIISLVSNARQSIPWGCSLDVARTALAFGKSMLRQKWLMTQDDVDVLDLLQLFPQTDEELLQGFTIKELSVKNRMLQLMTNDQVATLTESGTSLYNVMRQFRIRNSKRKKKTTYSYPSEIWGITRSVEQISSSVKVAGRLNSAYLRPLPVKKRLVVKNDFMAAMTAPVVQLDDKRQSCLDLFPEPFKVTILAKVPTVRNMLPTMQGDSSMIKKPVNLDWVKLKKFANIRLTRPGTEAELELVNQDTDALKKAEMVNFNIDEAAGLSFMSYTGAPLFRIHNQVLFSRPMTFTFKVDVPMQRRLAQTLRFDEIDFVSFMPIWISEKLLFKAKKEKCALAFGFGKNSDGVFALVQDKRGNKDAILLNATWINYQKIYSNKLRRNVMLTTRREGSPVNPQNYEVEMPNWHNNFLSGDTTAKYNYGNFFNTDADSAMKPRREIFNYFNCDDPHWTQKYRSQYPHFEKNSTEFELCRYNNLIGHKSVCKLKFIHTERPQLHQRINLTNNLPYKMIELDPNEEEGDFFSDEEST
jgi:hypothetical protein